MSKPNPRRPASSRGGVQRPRKIAGQPSVRAEVSDETHHASASPASGDDMGPEPAKAATTRSTTRAVPVAKGSDGPRRAALAGAALTSARTTRVLIATVAVLALVMLGLGVTMWLSGKDDNADANPSALSVPKDRPVVADQLGVQDGVDAAAQAAQKLVAVDYAKYDAEVAEAKKITTKRYLDEYLRTIGDVRADATKQKVVVQAAVVGQGVVRASRTRLEALLFLNQSVVRVREGKPETIATPYVVLMTMVHTDEGWLVDGLELNSPTDADDTGTSESTPPDDTKN